jgi:broad specificity phosphatase PhoE/adenylylsulfate kinase-like enzyme
MTTSSGTIITNQRRPRDRPANVKLVLVMVGLPARGKTHIARRAARYLTWLGYKTRVFNVGNYRRERLGSQKDHSFFDHDNVEARAARRAVAMQCLDDLVTWMTTEGGEIAIYDATNSQIERRATVSERCRAAGMQVVFVESVCEDPSIIESNIRQTKLRMPDYAGMDPDAAVQDFRERIAHYAAVYQPVQESEGSFVRIIDVGRKLEIHRIQGYLASRLVYFLMNIHPIPRPIYLTRHGESLYNVEGRIGGDSGLAPRGEAFASRLARWFETKIPNEKELVVFTSTLVRTVDTARWLGRPTVEWRALDEIYAGDCDGMTYDEIREQHPGEFEARSHDKLNYRYPRGESYRDVIRRLEPVIVEIERERCPILVVGHQAVLRALYAYLMDKPPRDCPFLSMPLHTVIELTPTTYGCDEVRFELGPDTETRDSKSPPAIP